MSNPKTFDPESVGAKVGTAIAKGGKATQKGVIFSVAFIGVHGKRAGVGFWKGMKAAGKAVAEEYNKQENKGGK